MYSLLAGPWPEGEFMNRTLTYALIAVAAGGGYGTALLANPPVELQPSSPGTTQNGNVNVSGKVLAKNFVATDSSATGQAVVGNATSTTGANFGGLFKTTSDGGTGVRGVASATTGNANGGTFQTGSPRGAGVRGFATEATGINFGLYGKAASPVGFAVYGVGNAAFTKRAAVGMTTVDAFASLSSLDDTAGGLGAVRGVNGAPTAVTGANRWGVLGQASGTFTCLGVGGYGESTNGGGSYGVYGRGLGTGLNYGVFGRATGGTTNYGGWFEGALYADSASSGVKAFLIDHPLDPANKFLEHSSIESDERVNLYRGSVKTDAQGYATVTLPAWFSALNEDVKYQLTVVDEADSSVFVMAKVVQRLKNGKFKIRSSVPATSIDWQISGRRHDPTSMHFPLQVERVKNADERGRYLVPAAFGKGPDLAMASSPDSDAQPSHSVDPRRR